MGNVEARFHQLLLTGEHEQALQFWSENKDFQSKLDLKMPVRGSLSKDSPLHCLLRVGNYRQPFLKILMHEFIEKGADPLFRNGFLETSIHVVCCSQRHSARENKARREILEILLEELPSIDPQLNDSIDVRNVPAKGGVSRNIAAHLKIGDKSRNTPLHLAAASGLLECIELLLRFNAPLFAKNVAKQTPLDSAVAAKQIIIAPILESQMVLSREKKEDKIDVTMSFYTPAQLKQVQVDIVKDVSVSYNVSSDVARALLSAFSWSKHLLDEAWERDKEEACSLAGLDPNALAPPTREDQEVFNSLSEKPCEICYEPIPPQDIIDVPCGHNYCRQCWASYVEVSVKEGGGKDIPCPGFDCSRPVPMGIIAKLVSDELFRKYSDLNLQHFVDTNQDIKWCPYPNCGQAVVKREGRTKDSELGGKHGVNVECGNGHGFCWNCFKEAHEPCECEVWDKWLQAITKMCQEGNVDYDSVAEQAEADARWIIDNTKPCPRCSAPIQKNEGCNHMTCKKCRYDFCWVCLDPWNSHSYRTGGYFSCNRYGAQRKAQTRVEETRRNLTDMYRKSATEDKKAMTEKFNFYNERYRSHKLSMQIECKMLMESRDKTRSLVRMRRVVQKKVGLRSTGSTSIEESENFLEGILRVLLRARRLLATSYGIGFLIPDEKKEVRDAHETIQGKLEEVIETLAQMVSRPYLNTPQADMAERSRDVEFIQIELLEMLREVLVTGLQKEPVPKQHTATAASIEDDNDDDEIDPLILFAHLALRHDPQFREIFEQLLEESNQHQRPRRQL